MKLPNRETFCVAPWFQIRNENNGRKQVCCNILSEHPDSVNMEPIDFLNTQYNQKLKGQLHRGVRAKACARCWQSEDNGVTSLRQKLNGVLTNNSQDISNTWLHSYFNRKNNFLSEDILMADIKIGNTCNYSCVMCVPDDSSMIYNGWRNRPNAPFIQEKLKHDPGYLDRIKANGYKNMKYRQYVNEILGNKKLKFLKILGGEPLLDKYLIEQLASLPDQQKSNISLYFVTNGSRDLLECRDTLGSFRSILFTISIEGTGKIQEYARYGSNWKDVSANIINFQKKYPNDIFIHHTMQTATILGFRNLAEWISRNGLALSVGLVDNPKHMGLSSLPTPVREQVKKEIDSIDLNIKQQNIGDEQTVSLRDIIRMCDDTPFDREEHKKFIEYIKWYEEGKGIPKLSSIFPALFVDTM